MYKDMANKKFFLLTGDPGVGKTTLVKKLVSSLSNDAVKTSGFYTEEVRRNGTREGFDVVSLEGVRGPLARDQAVLNTPAKFTVGKYGVLVPEFESVALPTLSKKVDEQSHILVIDEIGKMEFYSAPFKSKIKEIFGDPSSYLVLATIPNRRSDPLIEKIRNSDASKVWMVTRENRNNIEKAILKGIKESLNTSY